MMTKKDCHDCDGSGGVYYSCCGDPFEESPDSDICPTCGEHCGEGDFERCESCNGNGHIFETDNPIEYERELERIAMLVADHEETVARGTTDNWKVGARPPRPELGKAWYNTQDGRLWQFDKGSWTPMSGRIDQSRLPVTRLKNIIFNIADLPETIDAADAMRLFEDSGYLVWRSKEKMEIPPFKLIDNESITNTNKTPGDYSIFARRGAVDLQGPEERNW